MVLHWVSAVHSVKSGNKSCHTSSPTWWLFLSFKSVARLSTLYFWIIIFEEDKTYLPHPQTIVRWGRQPRHRWVNQQAWSCWGLPRLPRCLGQGQERGQESQLLGQHAPSLRVNIICRTMTKESLSLLKDIIVVFYFLSNIGISSFAFGWVFRVHIGKEANNSESISYEHWIHPVLNGSFTWAEILCSTHCPALR